MATSDGVRETRTASSQGSTLETYHFLQNEPNPFSQRPISGSSTAYSEQFIMKGKKRADDSLHSTRPKANSSSSHGSRATSSTRAENRMAQKEVRTLPPWIDSFEEDDDDHHQLRPTDPLLASPSRAHSASHHFAPQHPERRISQDGFVEEYEGTSQSAAGKMQTGFFGSHRDPVPGRKWDHVREHDPVIMRSGVLPTSSPWRNFIKASMYGPGIDEDPKTVDQEFLARQTPGYEKPWRGDTGDNEDSENIYALLHAKKRRKNFIKRLQTSLLMHPFVPLTFRLTVLTTSIISLGISSSVYHLSNKFGYEQGSSTVMAVVVDAVAIPYIFYVTWDEYTGKPLGLRPPRAKIRLVLLDLFFIIFESANLSLAFGALTDDAGSCIASGDSQFNGIICHRLKTLCAILLIALIAWSLTFAVSIFRLVERVGGREEND